MGAITKIAQSIRKSKNALNHTMEERLLLPLDSQKSKNSL